MKITHDNFHLGTEATFKACKKPKRKPDYVSKSGSAYWYGGDSIGQYVIRESGHWVTRFSNDTVQKFKHLRYSDWNCVDGKFIHNGTVDRKFEIPNLTSDCYSIATCKWYLFCPNGVPMKLTSSRCGAYMKKHHNKKDWSTTYTAKSVTVCGKCYLKDFVSIAQ